MTTYYSERVLRYRILRHEDLPAEHKAEYRKAGINPDDNWSLIWSFNDKAEAEAQLAECNKDKPRFWTYKLVDAGKATTVRRPAWF